jgi:hypothetical protein
VVAVCREGKSCGNKHAMRSHHCHVEDGIEQLARLVGSRPATELRFGDDEWAEYLPLIVDG